MKFFAVLGLLSLCCAVGTMAAVAPAPAPANSAVALPTPPPPPTLAQDLKEIFLMIPMLPISDLTTRYLLNDAQFQAVIRIMNSLDAYSLQMTFRSQPEFIAFISWTRQQIALSGKFKIEFEAEEMASLFNRLPYWASTVSGWQGFANEFMLYYPEAMIQGHITMKVAQNGIFTQFIQRLKALKPVYERVIALPEAQRVIAALQAEGVNTVQLDTFIRNQFGWQVPAIAAPGAPVSPAAPVQPAAPAAASRV